MSSERTFHLPTVVCLIHDSSVRERIARTLREGGCRIDPARAGTSTHAVLIDRIADVASARSLFGAPVLIVGAFETAEEIEDALLAGADDYVPFRIAPESLASKIAALREGPADVLTFEDVVLYRKERILRRGTRRIRLTRLQTRLVESFMARPYACHSIDELLATIWRGSSVKAGTVHTFVCFLRRKLNSAGEPDLIENVHGLGYRFRPSTLDPT